MSGAVFVSGATVTVGWRASEHLLAREQLVIAGVRDVSRR